MRSACGREPAFESEQEFGSALGSSAAELCWDTLQLFDRDRGERRSDLWLELGVRTPCCLWGGLCESGLSSLEMLGKQVWF